MDLDRDLRALAADVDWPATPKLRLELAPQPQPRHRRGRLLAVALVVAVAVAVAFAVPQSRGALLRFLHLGGATIERVAVLPPAEERPLAASIGPVISLAQAEAIIGKGLVLPPLVTEPPLHLVGGPAVSLVFAYHGEPVLLSEFPQEGFFKKLASGGTSVVGTHVGTAPAFWISGDRHDFFFTDLPPRLAGNVLIWVGKGVTYRLEGRLLSQASAIGLARSLVPG